MLVIARKIGQSIVMNKNVFITIFGINGNQVRLGIDAPNSLFINREAISHKINEPNNEFHLELDFAPVRQLLTH